jgi:hypothetical protein
MKQVTVRRRSSSFEASQPTGRYRFDIRLRRAKWGRNAEGFTNNSSTPGSLIRRPVGLFYHPSKFATNRHTSAKIVIDSRKTDIEQVLYAKPSWILHGRPRDLQVMQGRRPTGHRFASHAWSRAGGWPRSAPTGASWDRLNARLVPAAPAVLPPGAAGAGLSRQGLGLVPGPWFVPPQVVAHTPREGWGREGLRADRCHRVQRDRTRAAPARPRPHGGLTHLAHPSGVGVHTSTPALTRDDPALDTPLVHGHAPRWSTPEAAPDARARVAQGGPSHPRASCHRRAPTRAAGQGRPTPSPPRPDPLGLIPAHGRPTAAAMGHPQPRQACGGPRTRAVAARGARSPSWRLHRPARGAGSVHVRHDPRVLVVSWWVKHLGPLHGWLRVRTVAWWGDSLAPVNAACASPGRATRRLSCTPSPHPQRRRCDGGVPRGWTGCTRPAAPTRSDPSAHRRTPRPSSSPACVGGAEGCSLDQHVVRIGWLNVR